MALGRRRCERQMEFWVPAEKLGNGPRNVFYDRLNQLLAETDFDRQLEEAVEPYYEKTGRKGLPPGVYFRMIFIGYFEDISSQRGIAWRCDDSRSLARFLGYAPGESTPDHRAAGPPADASCRSAMKTRSRWSLHAAEN